MIGIHMETVCCDLSYSDKQKHINTHAFLGIKECVFNLHTRQSSETMNDNIAICDGIIQCLDNPNLR